MFALPETSSSPPKPQIPDLPLDDRSKTCLSEFINAMLDLEWWRRPSTSSLLPVLALLKSSYPDDYPAGDYRSEAHGLSGELLNLVKLLRSKYDTFWTEVMWRPKWYRPLPTLAGSDSGYSVCCNEWLFWQGPNDIREDTGAVTCSEGRPRGVMWTFFIAEFGITDVGESFILDVHEIPARIVEFAGEFCLLRVSVPDYIGKLTTMFRIRVVPWYPIPARDDL